MHGKELEKIKEMALNYSDPVRGKILALVATVEQLVKEVETYKKHAYDFEEMYKQEHREKNKLKKEIEAAV